LQTGGDAPPRSTKEIPYHQTQQFRDLERLCFSVLTDYLHLLRYWKKKYAPETENDPLDDRFVEACQMKCPIEHLCDVFIFGSTVQRTAAVRELWGSGRIKRLKEYVERKRREEMELGKQRKCRNDLAI
jgi:hypothetical protein